MPNDSFAILVFDLGGQHYGLPATDVQELVRAVAIVPLPRAPAIVEGVINLRGKIVPVLDIRSRFRIPARPLEHTDHFIVAHAGERLVVLRVDRVLDLVEVDPSALQEVKDAVPGAEYVTQVAKWLHRLVLIHDLRTFLSQAESIGLDEALAVAHPSSEPRGGP